jgi:hypothetical protein
MAPIMMMELKLVAIAFGVAQAVTKVCVDDAQFDGLAEATMSSGFSCKEYQEKLPAFTASPAACAGMITLTHTGEAQKAAMVFGQFQPCCKSGKNVCAQYSMNPCATAANFKPLHKYVAVDKTEPSCAVAAGMAPFATPSVTSCSGMATSKAGSMLVAEWSGFLVSKGCCTGNGAAITPESGTCYAFQMNPCADKAAFNTQEVACAELMSSMKHFVPDTVTCAAMSNLKDNGKLMTNKVASESAAKACCSDKVSVCANPPAPAKPTAAPVSNDASTVVCTGWMHMLMAVSAIAAMVH